MRRVNWFITAAALGLGIIMGLVVSAAATPASPTQFIKYFSGKNTPVTAGLMPTESQEPVTTNPLTTGAPAETDPAGLSYPSGKTNLPAQAGLGSPPAQAGLSTGAEIAPGTGGSLTPDQPNPAVPSQLAGQIIADYKQDIGLFFDAWKSKDMTAFRTKLAKAYTGDLLDKHARQAEPFLSQGVGIEVSQINFDSVIVEEAANNSATLRADYRYTARDYSLRDAAPNGDPQEQTVHARVNLVKLNSRWLVTGETILNQE